MNCAAFHLHLPPCPVRRRASSSSSSPHSVPGPRAGQTAPAPHSGGRRGRGAAERRPRTASTPAHARRRVVAPRHGGTTRADARGGTCCASPRRSTALPRPIPRRRATWNRPVSRPRPSALRRGVADRHDARDGASCPAILRHGGGRGGQIKDGSSREPTCPSTCVHDAASLPPPPNPTRERLTGFPAAAAGQAGGPE